MKTFRKILLWILAIIAVLVIIAFLLPKTYKVERSITMKANTTVVYGLVCDLTKWKLWSTWTKDMDSTVVYQYSENQCVVGSKMNWEGKRMGIGEMTLSEIQPGQRIGYDLSFDKGKYLSNGFFAFEPAGDSLKVTWNNTGDLGYNPFSRYMGLLMNKMMGPDFEKGLAKLKMISEERSGWPKIEEITFEPQTVALIRDSAGPKDYEKVMGGAFGELRGYVKANNLTSKGYPFAIYIKWDSVTQFSVMDIGIAIDKAAANKGRVRVENLPAQKVVMAYYLGPYDKTYGTYMALGQYIKEGRFEEAGGPWEIYVTDPMTEKDTAKWETRIAFPVK